MNIELILFNPLMVVLLGYIVIAAALTLLVQPVRLHLVEVVEELAAEPWSTKEDGAYLDRLAANCMSFIVAAALPLAVIGTTVDHVLGPARTFESKLSNKMRNDPRFHRVLKYYFLSILAGSPLLGLLSLVLIMMDVGIRMCFQKDGVQEAVEYPVMRASDVKCHGLNLAH